MKQIELKLAEAGIDESKRVFAIVGHVITTAAGVDKNDDNKVTLVEIGAAVQSVAMKALIEGLPDIKGFKQEATDYSETEKATLISILEEETKLAATRIEYLIEKIIKILLDVIDLALEFSVGEPDLGVD